MPVDTSKFLGNQFDISFQMALNGQYVTFLRGSTLLDPQKAVPVSDDTAGDKDGAAGYAGMGRLVWLGYRDYPGQATFDVIAGDEFTFGGTIYRVEYVNDTKPRRREAYCESAQ